MSKFLNKVKWLRPESLYVSCFLFQVQLTTEKMQSINLCKAIDTQTNAEKTALSSEIDQKSIPLKRYKSSLFHLFLPSSFGLSAKYRCDQASASFFAE